MESISDNNFEEKIGQHEFVLVDFFATWCEPCSALSPILESIAGKFKDKIFFLKANLDEAPSAAQKYGVEKIPTVILFRSGKPFSGFVGLAHESAVNEWLNDEIKKPAEKSSGTEENKILAKKYQEYAQANGFNLNPDQKSVERVIRGLLANKEKYGEMYCPCRRISGNKDEDAKKICPCFWHKDEIKKDGHCFCRLYVK